MRLAAFPMAWCLWMAGCADDVEPAGTEPAVPPRSAGGERDDGRVRVNGDCGGVAGLECPDGRWCDIEAPYPDASGTCRPEGTCDEPADCVLQDLPHAACVGEWRCLDGRCAWQCDGG